MDKQKKVKLVCLPYAGGSAMMYKAWIDRFADTAEIVQPELPGRGGFDSVILLRSQWRLSQTISATS
jgi:surfactin synthase thioesterase subunit